MRMVDSGFGRDEIMAALDLGRSTYYKWLALYQRAGMVAMLESGVSTGAPTTLSCPRLMSESFGRGSSVVILASFSSISRCGLVRSCVT
jgi:transposase